MRGAPLFRVLCERVGGENPYQHDARTPAPSNIAFGALELRRDLEGDAGVVFAACGSRAEEVAFVVDDHAPGEVAVGAAEFVHGAVFPLAVLLQRQFEDDATGIRAATLVPAGSDPV